MQGEMQATVFRFKLGGFEVATIFDSKAIREGLHPMHGANATAAEVQALARDNNIDPHRIEHRNIPTVVNTGKELILFDTGNGALPREYEQLRDDDKPKAVVSRNRILDQVAADKMFTIGFHMPFPGLGWIDKTAAGFRWVPHSYQMTLEG